MKSKLVLLWGLFLAGAAASAGTIIALDLKALTQRAEVIVLGRCLESSVRWNAERTRIYTDWTVAVDQAIKGAPVGKVIVRQLGGELEGKGMIVAGVNRLTLGEEVVLFLGPAEDSARRIVGLSQGRFTVQTDPQTGRKQVRTGSVPSGALASQSSASAAPIPLDQFLAQVRAMAEIKP